MEENNQILKQSLMEAMTSLKPCTIVKPINKQALDFYVSNESIKQIDLSYLDSKDFWEVIYNEVLNITDPDIDIFNVSAPNNFYKSAIIKLNDYVQIIIVNRNHEYDLWLDDLQKRIRTKNKEKVKK